MNIIGKITLFIGVTKMETDFPACLIDYNFTQKYPGSLAFAFMPRGQGINRLYYNFKASYFCAGQVDIFL